MKLTMTFDVQLEDERFTEEDDYEALVEVLYEFSDVYDVELDGRFIYFKVFDSLTTVAKIQTRLEEYLENGS